MQHPSAYRQSISSRMICTENYFCGCQATKTSPTEQSALLLEPWQVRLHYPQEVYLYVTPSIRAFSFMHDHHESEPVHVCTVGNVVVSEQWHIQGIACLRH